MCLIRITIANLSPNMNHFDDLDFSECCSEEVISLFWRLVYAVNKMGYETRVIHYMTGADPGFSWGGGGCNRLCALMYITNAKPKLPYGSGPALGVFWCSLVLSEPYKLFLSILIQNGINNHSWLNFSGGARLLCPRLSPPLNPPLHDIQNLPAVKTLLILCDILDVATILLMPVTENRENLDSLEKWKFYFKDYIFFFMWMNY